MMKVYKPEFGIKSIVNNEAINQKFNILANIAKICVKKGMEHVIISPGSRSAPLTVSFARQPGLTPRVVFDERAAGFIALGLAQQTRRPVGLICTSGTAALNYSPAVAEAFYQEIPLIVFTADRPPEWLDQQDGQTIHQTNLYGPHCRGSFDFPVDTSHPDAQWQAERLISEALNRALGPISGPVHINIPLREPLYPAPDNPPQPNAIPKIIQQPSTSPTLPPAIWDDLHAQWRKAKRKLIIAGLQPPDSELAIALTHLQQDPSVAVIADITANLPPDTLKLPHSDMILGTKVAEALEKLKPDLVVSFGGPVVSKYLKLFLRKNRPAEYWHLHPGGQPIDTFKALTRVLSVYPAYFFKHLLQKAATPGQLDPTQSYQATWLALEKQATSALPDFLTDQPFNEFRAVREVIQALPTSSHLQLGNSMAVRYANFIGLGPDAAAGINVNGNRGTSGIDGSMSTTVGAALTTDQITTLLTGDLAFFYDRNALWHQHVPANLRVVILNNGGGGIFKMIDGPNQLPAEELDTYFFTPQPLNAANTAKDHNCAYFHCHDLAGLRQHLPEFFAPGARPKILEIATKAETNTQVFQRFKALLAGFAVGE